MHFPVVPVLLPFSNVSSPLPRNTHPAEAPSRLSLKMRSGRTNVWATTPSFTLT